ncbi:MAG: hypothetical protein HY671_05945 [Chloroflexi bacterium]|nr:hypothetical protein [Chloroflexota bacterium]
MVVLILVTAVPAGNPYIGLFTLIYLPALVTVGGLVFLFGAARETCEQCHWPQRFSGNISRILRTYNTDEENLVRATPLVFKVGAGEPTVAQGIHWHISARVWYVPTDEKRQEIGWVGVEADSGLKEYVGPQPNAAITAERIAKVSASWTAPTAITGQHTFSVRLQS